MKCIAEVRVIRRLGSMLFLFVLLAGCSAVRIESAKSLGSAGQQAAEAGLANIFVSDDACRQALDVDTFVFHYQVGENPPPALLARQDELQADYERIHAELSSRRNVFARLGKAYKAFSGLASGESAAEADEAIGKLGSAINEYAASRDKDPVLSSSARRTIAEIGGMVVVEVSKRKIKRASILIRERLDAFLHLLKDPMVKEQLLGFRKELAGIEGDGIQLLWSAGAFDPSPLLDQIGSDLGLKASLEVGAMLQQDKNLSNGIGAVINARLQRKLRLIEEDYAASVEFVEELIDSHRVLEKDEKLDLARLHQIIAEQQRIAASFGAATK